MMTLSCQVCKGCGIRYLQADFLPHRVAGYCTEECWHHEPRGIPTAECVGWKNGIPASTQRKKIDATPTSYVEPRQWTFCLARVPHPLRQITGAWELVNWHLCKSVSNTTITN